MVYYKEIINYKSQLITDNKIANYYLLLITTYNNTLNYYQQSVWTNNIIMYNISKVLNMQSEIIYILIK